MKRCSTSVRLGRRFRSPCGGLLVGGVIRFSRRLDGDDSRRLFIPLLVALCFVFLIGDSHIVSAFAVKDGLPAVALIFFSSGPSAGPAGGRVPNQ